jgi:mono/diheme cytochrome c family protein
MAQILGKLPTLLLACASLLAAAACQKRAGETEAQAEGRRLFDAMCAKCHGRDGRGGVPSAEGQPAPTNFCEPAFHGSRSDEDLKLAIQKGKGPMPPFGGLL